MDRQTHLRKLASATLEILSGLILAGSLTGCLVIGGTSRGGFFIWPGSLGLLVLIVVLAMVLRRR